MNESTYPLISIVIVNYNGKEVLENCLKSVYKSTYPNYEVILVDNASTDNSNLKAKKKFPKIKLIENKINLGSSGRNPGILLSKGKFVVLLDNDTLVKSNWLDEFLKNYKKNGFGMYQAKLMLMDNPDRIN